MTVIRLVSKHAAPASAKQVVSDASPKAYSQVEPAVVAHGNQHQHVGHAYLDHIQQGLDYVQWGDVLAKSPLHFIKQCVTPPTTEESC